MKNKKLLTVILALTLVASFCLAFTACGKDKFYTVSFAFAGEAGIESQSVKSGGKVKEPEEPQPENPEVTFAGWYADPDLTKEFNFATDKITKNTTIYAKWKSENEIICKVTYDFQGENETTQKTIDIVYGEYFDLAVPPPSSDVEYRFIGWFKEPDGKGTQYTNSKGVGDGMWREAADITVYAYWQDYKTGKKKAPDFTVYNIDENGEIATFTLSDYYGEKTIFLSIFATNCSWCALEMKDYFNSLVEEFGDDLMLIAVCSESISAIEGFIDKNGTDKSGNIFYNFDVFQNKNNSGIKSYETNTYPANYIIDKYGYLYTWNQGIKPTHAVDMFGMGTVGDNKAFTNIKRYINNAIIRAE